MNRVYFIGAGPGDPSLLTLKGASLLAQCQAVFAPEPFEETFVELLRGKTVRIPFDFYFDELLEKIEELLIEGNVAFLVPGDLTFYAPFQALIDVLGDRSEAVPGVGTVNAASAYLKKTLDLPGACNRAVITSPRILEEEKGAPALRDLAAPGVTLLLYMNHLPLPQLAEQLRAGYGGNVPIAIAHRLGLPGQEVVTGSLDDIVDRVGDRDFFNLENKNRRPALTLVIVGETLTATVGKAWWDDRRDKIWKYRS
ncbi:SAM-dependent methyltransferase [Desulfuromonas sp. TF]|jgi:precorrin-4/cobalt-precorrin-4 C11-methyltransferase|uniref:SAM-dependent methyltransferase n=1 Tax=Desulfuromonas sp. TF TaxID=1232410 RepID=UPI0003FD84D3|nr:SAM-dependent methyltransferase [Desulfuromonas sp. TF]